MAWLAVSRNGQEIISKNRPTYENRTDSWYDAIEGWAEGECYTEYSEIDLPKGSISKLLGREVKFEDCPIEI